MTHDAISRPLEITFIGLQVFERRISCFTIGYLSAA